MRYIQAILITIGAGLIIAALLTHKKALAVDSWEATQASLLYAYTQNLSSPTVAGANDWGTQKALVKFRYSVNGDSYTGNRLLLLDFIYFPQDKIHIPRNEDNKIIVYFNARERSASFVYKDYPYTAITMITIAGTIFLLIGIFLRKIGELILNALHKML